MLKFVLAQVLVAGWPFATAAPATPPPVQTPGSNVTITTCHAQLDPPPLRITYINTAKATATEIDFQVNSNAGSIEAISDRGKFETGKEVSHVFALPPDFSPLGLSSARCIVMRVVYSDGIVWKNPNPNP
ncbi:MAG TPA: hypothetical protein VKB39_07005 [Candidatus Baltobacteraceae bacterium]|nr:hypothetical protein [Candidatus Baltobacteraceae bacterium]